MFVYFFIATFLVIGLLVVESLMDRNVENLLFVVTFFVMFFIAGFRTYEVGSDSIPYVLLYDKVDVLTPNIMKFFTGKVEYGFLLLNSILYSISDNYVLLFSVFSFINLIIVFFVIKKLSPNMFLSLIIFFGYRFYTFSMSAIRASTSIAFCMLAYYYFVENKKLRSLFSIIVASSFHLSALAFLMIFVLDYIELNIKTVIVSIALTVVCYFNLNSVLSFSLDILEKYSSYTNLGNLVNLNLATVLNFAVVLVVFAFCEIFLKDREDYEINLLRKIMYFNLLISMIAINVPMFGRFILLFGSLMIIYIPIVVEQIKYLKNRFLSKVFVVFGFLSYFFIILILKPDWNILVPYKNVIFELLF